MEQLIDDNAITIAAWKPEAECTPEDRKLRMVERQACKNSFVRFLRYCRIIEPPNTEGGGGVIPLEMWPHIKEAISLFLTKKLIVWLKSRQIGASWLVAAYSLWFALFHQGANIMIFSKGETEAMELLAKCDRIWGQLPDFLKLKKDPNSRTEIGFPVMLSAIRALAATETAGISFTASIVVCDEWEEHPYAVDNFLAAKPTISSGGQFIGIFTVNKKKPDTLAKTTFRDAMAGQNGFSPIFTPWYSRPDRTEEWYKGEKGSLSPQQLEGLTPDLYMEQNFPASIEEALRPTQTVSAFNLKTLDEMMGDTRNPITVIHDGVDSSIVNIYKEFNLGQFFIAATDTSHGVGKDFSVTTVMNVKTGEVVADILNNTIPPEELAMHSVRLLDLFKNPLWFIEKNDWGGVTISTAQNLGYRNLGYRDDKQTKIGFDTQGDSRRDLWGALIPAINNRQIVIYNKDGLKQFFDVIRNVAKEGRIEAMAGRHDDYPICVGIGWLKKDEVQTLSTPLKPIETLHFAKNRRRW